MKISRSLHFVIKLLVWQNSSSIRKKSSTPFLDEPLVNFLKYSSLTSTEPSVTFYYTCIPVNNNLHRSNFKNCFSNFCTYNILCRSVLDKLFNLSLNSASSSTPVGKLRYDMQLSTQVSDSWISQVRRSSILPSLGYCRQVTRYKCFRTSLLQLWTPNLKVKD